MTARLTIVLGPDALKAPRGSQSIRIVAGSAGGSSAPAPRGTPRVTNGKAGALRPGSQAARLVAWASGRTKPFGVGDVVRLLKVTRAHASMVLTKAGRAGAVKRVGHGAYAAE